MTIELFPKHGCSHWLEPTRWEEFLNQLQTTGLTAVVGVLLLGGIATLLMRTQHAAEQRLAEQVE